jgi:hypothetical protein
MKGRKKGKNHHNNNKNSSTYCVPCTPTVLAIVAVLPLSVIYPQPWGKDAALFQQMINPTTCKKPQLRRIRAFADYLIYTEIPSVFFILHHLL